jgi:hypothetical protein
MDTPVPREGLSLAALRAFADEHRGRTYAVLRDVERPADGLVTRRFEELTTAQVMAAVTKPETEHAGVGAAHCTYAELLLAQARAAADPASSARGAERARRRRGGRTTAAGRTSRPRRAS